MLKIKIEFLFLSFMSLLTFCGADFCDPWHALNEQQHLALKEGKQVLMIEKIQAAPWPCFHIYRLVHATPMQIAAVFWDFKNAPHFIPRCVNVTIGTHLAPNIEEVDYELQIPIFSNEVSKVLNRLQSFSNDGAYEISWKVLQSKYSKSGRGSFLVVPHEDEALICYSNFVDPGSVIATVLRSYAERQVQEIVAAITTQIEYEVEKDPQQLLRQEEELQRALKQ